MAQALQHDQTALSHRISTTRATNDQPVPVTAGSGRTYAITSPRRWYKKTSGQGDGLLINGNQKIRHFSRSFLILGTRRFPMNQCDTHRGFIMTSPSNYQRYARECIRWAAQADIQSDREQFLNMARAWTHVARAQHDVTRQSTFDSADPKMK
jgi:hypothetical protein